MEFYPINSKTSRKFQRKNCWQYLPKIRSMNERERMPMYSLNCSFENQMDKNHKSGATLPKGEQMRYSREKFHFRRSILIHRSPREVIMKTLDVFRWPNHIQLRNLATLFDCGVVQLSSSSRDEWFWCGLVHNIKNSIMKGMRVPSEGHANLQPQKIERMQNARKELT